MPRHPFDFPAAGYHEAPRTVQVPGLPHDHQMEVWLPPSYHDIDAVYPVIWALDGLYDVVRFSAGSVSGLEAIIVSIGDPDEVTTLENITRREIDFTPRPEFFPRGNSIFKRMGSAGSGGADIFRDYLIDVLRPELAVQYRFDPEDNCLIDVSLSGVFSYYLMMTRPGYFNRYLLATTGFWGIDYSCLEEEYATQNNDLPARVHISAGGAELASRDWPLLPAMTDVVQRLALRDYLNLQLSTQVLGEYIHTTVGTPAALDGHRPCSRTRWSMFR